MDSGKKTILYFNLNVGSGVQYTGDIFENILVENFEQSHNVVVVHDQNVGFNVFDKLLTVKPDIVIMNDAFSNVIQALVYYSKIAKMEKVILLEHCDKNLSWIDNIEEVDEKRKLDAIFYQYASHNCFTDIIVLNNPEYSRDLPNCNVQGAYHPLDPSVYKIVKSWNERKKKFLYMGNLLPHKMAESFLGCLKETSIKIDCFSDISLTEKHASRRYLDLVYSIKDKNLFIHNPVKQNKVAELLNEYQYFVLPHNGYEPFNISLMQAIACGTIPLIYNESDTSWIKWADGLYLGTTDLNKYMHNIENINNGNFDISSLSEGISKAAHERFNFNRLKQLFIQTISGL